MIDNKLKFLEDVNDSGSDAVMSNIVQLIAEGYTIKIEPATVVGLDKTNLPGFTVSTVKDDTLRGQGTDTWLMQAMSDAYEATPE